MASNSATAFNREKPELSVVIVSFNTKDVLRQCLAALGRDTQDVQFEAIVVDNASADGTAEMIEAEFPAVRLIRNERNTGFAAGQNLGIANSTGEFILVLNSDVLLRDRCATTLIRFLKDAGEDAGLVGPRVMNSDGSLAPTVRRLRLSRPMLALSILNRHFRYSRWIPERFLRATAGSVLARVHDNFGRHDRIRPAEAVDGMCCLIRRGVLEETGLFDEQFFLDYEILDLAHRIGGHGWKILYYPDVCVTHLKHSSRVKLRKAVIETTRSELAYYSKHYPDQFQYLRRMTLSIINARLMACRIGEKLRPSMDRAREVEVLVHCREAARSFRSPSDSNERVPWLKAAGTKAP